MFQKKKRNIVQEETEFQRTGRAKEVERKPHRTLGRETGQEVKEGAITRWVDYIVEPLPLRLIGESANKRSN